MRRLLLASVSSLLLWCLPASAQSFTTVKIRNPAASAKTDAMVTFGMVFKPGDVPAGKSVTIAGATYQVDAKATHADGSLRHAVISLSLPALAASETRTLQVAAASAAAPGDAIPAADVLATAFDAIVTATVSSTAYSASARDGLAAAKTWLAGPVCTEWIFYAPLKNAAGAAHPHLHARFAIRAYKGLKQIRADVAVENDWAFEPSPSGFTYDAKVTVGKDQAYAKTGLAHTHHARWRKVFWWGGDSALDWEYDREYLFSTGAFPNYDRGVQVAASAISALPGDFEPMANGGLSSYMPATGAHSDIGPLPNFAAIYLLTQDARARRNVLANGGCGGSFQIHYRDKKTDLPASIDDWPYMTLLGNESDTYNPATGKYESFPAVTNGLAVHDPDDAHQPSVAFVPYLISGDYFQLEELQFWANYNMILGPPSATYRDGKKGLLRWGQNRAQAWSIRTLGQAAYITPDAHPLKKYFVEKILNNIDSYVNYYPKRSAANPLGHLEGHYPYSPFGMAPWMDDFFTWSIGYIHQLGFTTALPIAQWKSKFVVGRMTDPGYCWLQAGVYELQVGTAEMVPYTTFAQLYKANYPSGACTGLKMDGYPEIGTGYGANMQPALAMAVDVGAPGAKDGWDKYMTRNPKQDFTVEPQFAVVPKGSGTGAVSAGRAGAKAGNGPVWYMPGNLLGFELEFASDIFAEVFDTSGRQLFAGKLGRFPKGRHSLDPRREIAGAKRWPETPCLLRIRAVDAFKRSEYLKILPVVP